MDEIEIFSLSESLPHTGAACDYFFQSSQGTAMLYKQR